MGNKKLNKFFQNVKYVLPKLAPKDRGFYFWLAFNLILIILEVIMSEYITAFWIFLATAWMWIAHLKADLLKEVWRLAKEVDEQNTRHVKILMSLKPILKKHGIIIKKKR